MNSAASVDGLFEAHLTVVDVKRSVGFYRDVLGATVLREHSPAQFLTEPLDNHGAEQRCYLRDPDGYLIELGATTPRTVAG